MHHIEPLLTLYIYLSGVLLLVFLCCLTGRGKLIGLIRVVTVLCLLALAVLLYENKGYIDSLPYNVHKTTLIDMIK